MTRKTTPSAQEIDDRLARQPVTVTVPYRVMVAVQGALEEAIWDAEDEGDPLDQEFVAPMRQFLAPLKPALTRAAALYLLDLDAPRGRPN